MSILVALLGAPILSVLIEKVAHPIAGWIEEKVRAKAKIKDIEMEMHGAIENGQVEYFIMKYQEHLSDKMITRLRSVDRLRVLLNQVQQIVEEKLYTAKAAGVFSELASTLEEIMLDIPFTEAGIAEIQVADANTGENILIKQKSYLIALLKRFSAVVWTQLGKKLTPQMKGWALEYDASIQLVAVSPTIELAGILDRLNPEFQKFRKIYMDLMRMYREGLAIREHYLHAVDELKATKALVQHVKADQKLHSYMVPDHLESLIQGFQAEALFWQFNISDELPDRVEAFTTFVATQPEKVEKFLNTLQLSEDEITELYGCLDLYSDIKGGFRQAFKLFEKALDACQIEKHKTIIEERFATIEVILYA